MNTRQWLTGTFVILATGFWTSCATAADAAPTTPAAVTATIDAGKTDAPISPYVYGMFIEHIRDIINRGMWAEMLDDRKFFHPIAGPEEADPSAASPAGGAPRGRRRFAAPRRWTAIGPVDAITMDSKHAYAGDHSPAITLSPTEARGIRQRGLSLKQDKAYSGRIVLAGDPGAQVTVSLVWGDAPTERQSLSIDRLTSAYAKYPLAFQCPAESADGQLEITATGPGILRIGAVSLMPADNVQGWQPAVIAALKSLRSGVYRFPGGNFVSAHDWRDAIGDPDQRPPTWDPVWNALQPNDVGTDEFMTLCGLLEVEPYVTVNAGFGEARSAAEYVEYTNGPITTRMGAMRAANGHPEPYRVKFWGIGNEAWGDWQFGAMPFAQFRHKHNMFAKAMREVDPSIILIASGAMPDTMTGSKQSLRFGDDLVPAYLSPGDWTGGLLTDCFDNFDLISEHFYNYGNTHYSLAEGDQVPNDPNEPITDWMRRPANHFRIKYEAYKQYEELLPQLVASPKPLNVDEWAYTGNSRYPVYPSYAWALHEMFRHPDVFQMAGFTFATSLLDRSGGDVSLNANGLVFKIYRDHFGSIPVEVSGNSPQPKPADPPGGEQPVVHAGSDTFPLDVAAAWTEDHRALTVAILNPTEVDQSIELNVIGADLAGQGTLWRLAAAEGDDQNPSIGKSTVDSIPGSLTFPPFSVSVYELPVRE